MKILHIFDHTIPLHSGYTFRSLSILKEQIKIGWKTFHLTSSKQGLCTKKEEVVDGFLFYRSRALTSWEKKIPLINQWLVIYHLKGRLQEIVKLIKPDILHAHSPALNGIAALSVGKLFGIPVVYEVRAFWEDAAVDHGTSKEHGLRYKLTKALETYVVKNVDAVTTICQGLKNDLVSRGIDQKKITIIPNAVNIDKFTISARKNAILEKDYDLRGKVTLGFIGSFYAYEGLSFLIQALPQVINKHPNVKLLLIGGGPEEESLKQQVKQLNLSDYVLFFGRIDHDTIQDYYDLIDCLVYPRLSMRLTELVTPLKPLEAMAQKKLLIASDVGGHKELIEDGKTGFLFKSHDIDDLAKTINKLFAHIDEYEEIKNNGRCYVEKERNWKASVSNYQLLYKNLIGKQ